MSELKTSDGYRAIALIEYNVEAADDDHTGVRVRFTALAIGIMNTLTDMELKVFAAEVGLIVRKRFEMPPSPKSNEP